MTTTFHDTINRTGSSRWSTVRRHATIVKSKLLRWLFCVDDSLLEAIELESKIRDDIRDAMVVHRGGVGVSAITDCMKEIYNETGHDLTTIHRTVVGIRMEGEGPIQLQDEEPVQVLGADDTLAQLGLVANQSVMDVHRDVRVVPRFAAAVTLCLRAKFGHLSGNEANRLLIEREYLRVMRETSVRNVDVIAHQQWVINTYFNEGVFEELPTVRTRIPRWLREAFGSVPRAEPTIC